MLLRGSPGWSTALRSRRSSALSRSLRWEHLPPSPSRGHLASRAAPSATTVAHPVQPRVTKGSSGAVCPIRRCRGGRSSASGASHGHVPPAQSSHTGEDTHNTAERRSATCMQHLSAVPGLEPFAGRLNLTWNFCSSLLHTPLQGKNRRLTPLRAPPCSPRGQVRTLLSARDHHHLSLDGGRQRCPSRTRHMPPAGAPPQHFMSADDLLHGRAGGDREQRSRRKSSRNVP